MSPYPVFPWPERARRFAQRITPVSVIVGLAIAFAANMAFANTPGHSITVNPNTNLNPAGHVVNVSGTGFAANQSGFITQCIVLTGNPDPDCSNNIGTFTTSGAGAFGPIPVTVTNPFTGVNFEGPTTRTCSAQEPCHINATLSNVGGFADEPISFATNGTTSTTTTTVPPTTSTTTTTVPPTTSTTTTTVPPTTSTTTTTVPPTTSTTTTTVPPTTSTTTTTVPPTTSTTTTTVPPTTSTTTTTVPPTTSTTTTTVPPTTSTTVGPTTTTSTTAPVSPLCGRLLSQRAAINAQISAIQNGLPPSLPPDVRAQYIAQLEQIRDRANAQFDSALAAAGCPPAPTNG
ncbi:MAG: hypothetical protein AB1673_16295 [Actinomycetota bacterium]